MTVAHVLITGDSHTAAVKRGLNLLEAEGGIPEDFEIEVIGLGGGQHMLDPFFEVRGDVAVMTHPTFAKRLPVMPVPGANERGTVYVWCGLFHFAKAWRDRTWIDFRPVTLQGRGAPVSMGLITETALDWFKHSLDLLRLIRESGARVVVMETPRPFHHHWALKRIPVDVVAEIDRHLQRLMLGELDARSLELVRIPASCLDDHGFMLPEWRNEVETDEHHANQQFGAMMIQQLCAYLRTHPILD